MYTAMAFVALSMGVSSANLGPNPVWENDYRAAMARVTDGGKPMAVFVGSGNSGYTSTVKEGTFDVAVTKLLASKFVCLYVDTNTAAGKTLANAFQVNQGVIISDKSGLSQAFSASGPIPNAVLESALVRYADEKGVKKTETTGTHTTTTTGGCATSTNSGCCGKGGYTSSGCGTGMGGGCCFFGKGRRSGCASTPCQNTTVTVTVTEQKKDAKTPPAKTMPGKDAKKPTVAAPAPVAAQPCATTTSSGCCGKGGWGMGGGWGCFGKGGWGMNSGCGNRGWSTGGCGKGSWGGGCK